MTTAPSVLVTGATGFIGGHLVEALCRDGVPVTILARPGRDVLAFERLGVRVARGDLRDAESVRRALRECSVIYHLAAVTNRSAEHSVREYYDGNVRVTATLLEAAAGAGVDRVVHCSSHGVYGRATRWPIREDAPLRADTLYRRSKLAAERVVWPYLNSARPTVAIARPSTIYGPGALNWLPLFHDIQIGRSRVLGDLRHPFHVTYVDDVVAGLRCCGGAAAAGGIFNLAASAAPTLREFLEAIAAELAVEFSPRRLPAWPFDWAARVLAPPMRALGWEPGWERRVTLFTQPRAYDITRARTQLGYAPTVTLREGLRRTIAWYREQGHLPGRPGGG